MVMSLEKYVLLRAKVLKMNSKPLEALIAACLQDRPVQAAIPGKGAKLLFFSDGAGHRVKAYVKNGEHSAAREFVRIRTRLLHVYKLSPCKRRSLEEESAMA